VLGQLTATVAHELRNPLSTIRNSVFAVKEGMAARGLTLAHAFERIERGIVRCDRIITDLLDYARAREPRFEWVVVDDWLARLPDEGPELDPWLARPGEVAGEPDAIDMLLAEVEAQHADGGVRDPHQLELFGTLLTELHAMQKKPVQSESHLVMTLAGHTIRGTWEEILLQMKAADREWAQGSLIDFMASLVRRGQAETGIVILTTDPEAFIRGSAEAGVLRIMQ